MGLMDELSGMLGGQGGQSAQGGGQGGASDFLQRLSGGQANLHDPNSSDAQGLGQLFGHAGPDVLRSVFSQATQQTEAQEYHDHITPGVGGTNPLGNLGGPALGMVASSLLGNLTRGGGLNLASLLGAVPGLSTTNPNQMGAGDVAALASYARQNHPDALAHTAAEVGQQQPGLLQHLLGNKTLMAAASSLASKYLSH